MMGERETADSREVKTTRRRTRPSEDDRTEPESERFLYMTLLFKQNSSNLSYDLERSIKASIGNTLGYIMLT